MRRTVKRDLYDPIIWKTNPQIGGPISCRIPFTNKLIPEIRKIVFCFAKKQDFFSKTKKLTIA
jgi:hypothetical protein